MIGYVRTFCDFLRDRLLRLLGVLMSLNDPQWGRRPNQGPPDLEEIWRDFNRKLGGLFGGNKAETAPFKGAPTRDSLTQPPTGYQTPSPNFAYGTGPKESLNKEYNPAAGKYGE